MNRRRFLAAIAAVPAAAKAVPPCCDRLHPREWPCHIPDADDISPRQVVLFEPPEIYRILLLEMRALEMQAISSL